MTTQVETMAPRVSVLMTIYNAAPFLQRTLDSLRAQTFRDWELVAVENGSVDDSRGILAAWGDPRARVFALPENIGRTPALQYGLEQVRGNYVAVLDADDISMPERLERQVEYLDRNAGVVLLGTWTDFIDPDDRVVGEYRPPVEPEALLDLFGSENPVVHSSAMYRVAAAVAAGGYPRELPHSQDLGLWVRLLKLGRVAMLAQTLCQFRIQSGGLTQSRRNRIDVAWDQLRLLRTIRAELPLSVTARGRNREALAIARARYAWALAQHGRLLRAFGEALGAAFADPIALINNRVTRGLFAR